MVLYILLILLWSGSLSYLVMKSPLLNHYRRWRFESVALPIAVAFTGSLVVMILCLLASLGIGTQYSVDDSTPLVAQSGRYLTPTVINGHLCYVYYYKSDDGTIQMAYRRVNNVKLKYDDPARLVEIGAYSPAILPDWFGPVDYSYVLHVPKSGVGQFSAQDLTRLGN